MNLVTARKEEKLSINKFISELSEKNIYIQFFSYIDAFVDENSV